MKNVYCKPVVIGEAMILDPELGEVILKLATTGDCKLREPKSTYSFSKKDHSWTTDVQSE